MLSVLRHSRLLQRQGTCNISFVRYNYKRSSQNYLHSFRKYVFSSYFDFIKNYENKVELKFPAAFRIYRVFKIGLQDLFIDMKEFVKIIRKVNAHGKDLKCLTRKELDIYWKMPKDMVLVAPVLIISTLPLANYVVFPLAYLFPRHLLCSHFWTIQQRIQFAVHDQRCRLKHYKPVLRALQAKLRSLKEEPTYQNWSKCIALLGSGLHPCSNMIEKTVPLFGCGQIYHIHNLTSSHVHVLLRMHNLHMGWRRRRRLSELAAIIQLMDQAILKEGGISKLSQDEIRTACFLRGLNPTSMNTEDASRWLSQWVDQTKTVPADCRSFILHLPILMAYNHPSNWVLIH